MPDFLEEIENIRNHYAESNHKKAYNALRCLCRELCHDNPQFSDLISAADSIHSRCIDLEKSIIRGNIDSGGEESIRKMEIGYSYELLIDKVTEIVQDKQISFYKIKTRSMKKYRNKLRKIKMKIEDDLLDCKNIDKAEILKNILEYLHQLIDTFYFLIKKMQMVKEYE